MNLLTAILVSVPGVVSLVISCIYAYIKLKEPPKDDVWETAVRLMCARPDDYLCADNFARLYAALKFFKEHPELDGFSTLEEAMRRGSGKSADT